MNAQNAQGQRSAFTKAQGAALAFGQPWYHLRDGRLAIATYFVLEDGRVAVPLYGPRSITYKPFYSAARMIKWAASPRGEKALQRSAKFDPPRIPEAEMTPKQRFRLYLFRRTMISSPLRAANSMRSVTVRVSPRIDMREGSYTKFSGLGPPPPAGPVLGPASTDSNQFEGPKMPEITRRWVEESKAWVTEKQRQGKYRERNGYEALRFLRKCGEWVPVFPSKVGVPELRKILSHIGGSAPKTRRFYLSILGSFLSSLGNEVVRKSGIKNEYPNRAVRTPVLPGDIRDRLLDEAQGPERVILALLASARRPVEVTRALVSDLDLDRTDPDMAVRGKGGHGDVTARVPLNETVLRELRWYLPLRSQWVERTTVDSGHLVCRWNGDQLVGVSVEYLRRALVRVSHGARTGRWSLYSFRRGAATLLRDRKAEWEDIRDQLTHRSIGTTEGYVKSLQATKRAPSVARLLDAREAV